MRRLAESITSCCELTRLAFATHERFDAIHKDDVHLSGFAQVHCKEDQILSN